MPFLTETFLSNFADDNNLYSIGKDVDLIKGMLHKDFMAVTEWFYDNYMVLNPRKCHYMCLEKNSNNDKFVFDNLGLENRNEEVILGTAIDNKLTFDSHMKNICRKADQNFVHYREYLIIWK